MTVKLKYYKISGGCFNIDESEDVTAAKDYDTAIHEAWLMACESYDSYAGLHGIMSEENYIEEGEAENYEEAWDLYREDRESTIDYQAVEITKEQYEAFFGKEML